MPLVVGLQRLGGIPVLKPLACNRFVYNVCGMPAITPPAPPVASKITVMRGILDMLLRGDSGAVDRFTEAAACERFGVSRTPVREAFLELQALGLIELKRNCGAVVLPFGQRELSEIYHFRALLEIEATRLATENIPGEELETLLDSFRELREDNAVDPDWRHDRDLHHCITKHCGNRRLAAEIARYGNLIQSIREIVGETMFNIHVTSTEEHLRILEALESRDSRAAARSMADHLEQASESAAPPPTRDDARCPDVGVEKAIS